MRRVIERERGPSVALSSFRARAFRRARACSSAMSQPVQRDDDLTWLCEGPPAQMQRLRTLLLAHSIAAVVRERGPCAGPTCSTWVELAVPTHARDDAFQVLVASWQSG